MKFSLWGNFRLNKIFFAFLIIFIPGWIINASAQLPVYSVHLTSDSASGLCRYCLDKSKSFLVAGQPDSALLYLDFAIEKILLPEVKYLSLEYRLRSMKASCYVVKEEWDKALQAFRQSMKYVIPKSKYAGDTFLNIGTLFLFKEDFENAVANFKQALIIFTALQDDPDRIVQTLISLSGCYAEMEDPVSGRFFCEEAEKVLRASSQMDSNLYFSLYTDLGSIMLKQNQPEKALRLFQTVGNFHSINLNTGSKEKLILNRAYAECYQQLGKPDSALLYLNDCLTGLSVDPGMKAYSIASIYRSIGENYEAKNLPDSALASYSKGLQLLNADHPSSSRAPVEVFRLMCQMAKCELTTGRVTKNPELIKSSWADFNAAMDLTDTINDFLGHKGSRLLFNETAKNTFSGAAEAGFLLYGKNAMDTLFQISERSRNKILQTMIREKRMDLSTSIPDSIKNRKNLLLHRISSEMRKNTHHESFGREEELMSDLDHLFALKREIDSLQNQMENMLPESSAALLTEKITPAMICSALARDEAMLEYLISGDSVLFIFGMTRENSIIERVILPKTFNAALSKLKSALRSAKTDRFVSDSYELYQYLVKPVFPLIKNKKHLIIIPDEAIALLPFECLVKNNVKDEAPFSWSQASYLIKDFEISYALSAASWLQIPKQGSFHGTFGGFAPVFRHPEEKFPELVFSGKEIKTVAGILSEKSMSTLTVTDSNATEREFKEKAGSLSIIHIATHSVIDDQQPENSGLIFYPYSNQQDPLFSEDGVLYDDEILNLDLAADLVVLSACASGKGKITRTEGVLALTRAFIVAGASNVLYAAWNISDQQTPPLMAQFYTHLASGESYAASLQAAKLKMIAHPSTALPYLWAGFMLLGK